MHSASTSSSPSSSSFPVFSSAFGASFDANFDGSKPPPAAAAPNPPCANAAPKIGVVVGGAVCRHSFRSRLRQSLVARRRARASPGRRAVVARRERPHAHLVRGVLAHRARSIASRCAATPSRAALHVDHRRARARRRRRVVDAHVRGGDDVRRRARESTRDAGARRATRIFRIRESSVDANRRRIDRRARLTSAPTPADVLRIHAPARRGAARRAADAAHGGRRRTVSVRVPGTKRARGALLRRGTTRAHAGGAQARDGVPGVPRAGGARRGESGRTRGAARRRRRERRRRDGRGDAKARRRAVATIRWYIVITKNARVARSTHGSRPPTAGEERVRAVADELRVSPHVG